jgi:hypothetical protein
MLDKLDQRHRKEERVGAALPVDLGNATGITRDVSASGVFFETDASYALGSTISFTVELDTPGGKMLLKCQGEIVRIEQRLERVGVAVKITESVMVAAE